MLIKKGKFEYNIGKTELTLLYAIIDTTLQKAIYVSNNPEIHTDDHVNAALMIISESVFIGYYVKVKDMYLPNKDNFIKSFCSSEPWPPTFAVNMFLAINNKGKFEELISVLSFCEYNFELYWDLIKDFNKK